jgi:hypothetical protein
MGERRLAIRILGLAVTTRGFAYAVTEGPDRLIDWGNRRPSSIAKTAALLAESIIRVRPLFVACEVARNRARSRRARVFNIILQRVCARHGIMILCVQRAATGQNGLPAPTNLDIARLAAARFPALADSLPKERQLWEGPDDRLGVFLAGAATLAGWNHFQSPRQVERSDI